MMHRLIGILAVLALVGAGCRSSQPVVLAPITPRGDATPMNGTGQTNTAPVVTRRSATESCNGITASEVATACGIERIAIVYTDRRLTEPGSPLQAECRFADTKYRTALDMVLLGVGSGGTWQESINRFIAEHRSIRNDANFIRSGTDAPGLAWVLIRVKSSEWGETSDQYELQYMKRDASSATGTIAAYYTIAVRAQRAACPNAATAVFDLAKRMEERLVASP
ncbi:hypothetical protein HY480_01365 [Candidatus Uhrbacteria bacterium]|nr:hypothetical protein [Candidatus Uhrbacteria bacterium]